jgi:hypothetical protein
MDINYLEFYNPFEMKSGGGPIVNRTIIQEGINRGHRIEVYSAFSLPRDLNCDFWILSDVFNEPDHPDSSLRIGMKPFISYVVNEEKFIHINNAYVDVCFHPYAYPKWHPEILDWKKICKNRNCPWTTKLGQDLFTSAILSIFVSPLHRNEIESYDISINKDCIYKMPLASHEQMLSDLTSRTYDAVTVGTCNEARGWSKTRAVLDLYDRVLAVGDWRYDGTPPPYHRGSVDRLEVHRILADSKRFVHMPVWAEPCSLVVREALLYGCEIIANDRVGAMTYDGTEKDTEGLWEKIEERII